MEVACKDVSGIACDYVATGDTAEEVKAKLMDHGNTVHSEEMEAMTDEDKSEMAQKMEAQLANQ